MIEDRIRQMAEQRRQAALALNAFDASLWLGQPRGFPLAAEMDIQTLCQAMREQLITGGLLSHWDGHAVAAQEGNAALLSLELPAESSDLGLVFTGLPLIPSEGGPLPGVGDGQSHARAVRLFPKSHAFPLSDWVLAPLVTWMLDRHLPMLLWHTEIDWKDLYAFARAFPQLAIVIESQHRKIIYHLRPLLALMKACPNTHLEISNLTGPAFDLLLREIDPERLVFGSFMPVGDPLVPLGMILDAGMADAERRLVAGDNLRRLIGGVDHE